MSRGGPLLACLLAAASGLLQVLIFPSFDYPFLAPAALTPLLIAVAATQSPRSRFLLGWLTGMIFWAGTCYWIHDVMHRYAGLSAPAAAAIFCGFFIFKGLHLALFAVLARSLLLTPWAIPAVAALWVAIEGSHQYLGFTWLQLGNAGAGIALLTRIAPVAGIYGLSFALAMMNVALAMVVLRRPRRQLAWLGLLLALCLLPALPDQVEGRQTARLLQPNIHPDELKSGNWTPERQARHLRRMAFLSTEGAAALDPARPDLVIWPEYPVPAYYSRDPSFRNYMKNLSARLAAPLIFNSTQVLPGAQPRPLNSAMTLDARGTLVSQYDKIFLVPFGEFVPWPFSLFIDKVTMVAGDFVPGERVVVTPLDGRLVGTFICYESVFAGGVREFASQGAEVLVNISNDSWYGATAARYQHLLIVRMRAIENARWILRATNDGITSVIDPAGRITARLPSFEQGVLAAKFDYSSRITWFTRFGEWFWWLMIFAGTLLLWLSRSRKQ